MLLLDLEANWNFIEDTGHFSFDIESPGRVSFSILSSLGWCRSDCNTVTCILSVTLKTGAMR